jgi:hypothetical protein
MSVDARKAAGYFEGGIDVLEVLGRQWRVAG